MKIILEQIGKKFEKEWIFKKVDLTIEAGSKWLIAGNNGSGKSTFLQLISGKIKPSKGIIQYFVQDGFVPIEKCYQHISIASPSLELIEVLTLEEMIQTHFQFNQLIDEVKSIKNIPEMLQLAGQEHKRIDNFSSGMKQRVKLGLAVLSKNELLLLDEPLSNLDENGIEWYKQFIPQYATNKTILVASNNQPDEYFFCNNTLNIINYKGN